MKTLDSKSKYLKFQPQEPRVFFQKDQNRWTSSATWHNKNLTSILSVSLKICDLCWPLLTCGSLKSVSVKNGDLECHDVLKRSKFLSREIFKLEKQICLDKKMSNFDSLQKTAKNRRRRRKVRGGGRGKDPHEKKSFKNGRHWSLMSPLCSVSNLIGNLWEKCLSNSTINKTILFWVCWELGSCGRYRSKQTEEKELIQKNEKEKERKIGER